MSESGWIGVDLDGTLAHYDGWRGMEHVGEPIPAMALRVKAWIRLDVDVRIFTARAHGGDDQIRIIQDWTAKHFGVRLPVTATKDFSMISLFDDRAVQIEMNTGRRVDGQP